MYLARKVWTILYGPYKTAQVLFEGVTNSDSLSWVNPTRFESEKMVVVICDLESFLHCAMSLSLQNSKGSA